MVEIVTGFFATLAGIVGCLIGAAILGQAAARNRPYGPIVGGAVLGLSMGLFRENGWVPVGVGLVFGFVGWLIYRYIITSDTK